MLQHKVKNIFILFVIPSVLGIGSASASGTVIGNGGDPLFSFLEATRYSFVETIKLILNDPTEAPLFCKQPEINDEQQSFCKEFFLETKTQYLALNQGLSKTQFVLREEPLMVIGPDGRPQPVAARTPLGPNGDIEFHRDSIRVLAPSQVLFLIGHENGHKVVFRGSSIPDNDRIGPFSSGRELLDSVANAIKEVALRRGKIGRQFGLRDSFQCSVHIGDSSFNVTSSSPRLFMDKNLMSYETSFGRAPGDVYLSIPEMGGTKLLFRAIIHEPANCSDEPEEALNRRTDLSIVRVSPPDASGHEAEEVVNSREMPGFNPLCDKKQRNFSLSYTTTGFSCDYYGSEGTTTMLRVHTL